MTAPVNTLLDGGLSPGQILDVSGPPNGPKEKIVLASVRSAVELREEVLFVGVELSSALESLHSMLILP